MSTQSHYEQTHCTRKAIVGLLLAILAWTVLVIAIWVYRMPIVAVVSGVILVHSIVLFLRNGKGAISKTR